MALILDFVLLLGGIGGLILGLKRGLFRTILSTIALLLATAFAALIAVPLVGIFVREAGAEGETPIGIVFAGLLVAIYALLEALLRRSFPDTRIRAIEWLDNVLGFLAAPGWTLLALALAALVVAYMTFALTGAPGTGLFGDWISRSNLIAFLKDFFDIPVSLMRFLFPSGLPQPLAFFVGS